MYVNVVGPFCETGIACIYDKVIQGEYDVSILARPMSLWCNSVNHTHHGAKLYHEVTHRMEFEGIAHFIKVHLNTLSQRSTLKTELLHFISISKKYLQDTQWVQALYPIFESQPWAAHYALSLMKRDPHDINVTTLYCLVLSMRALASWSTLLPRIWIQRNQHTEISMREALYMFSMLQKGIPQHPQCTLNRHYNRLKQTLDDTLTTLMSKHTPLPHDIIYIIVRMVLMEPYRL